ncbi:hypothetical protein D1627_17415 [Pontibacter oryzae]|uniref:Uncharacterized protein n=1 Tax=Pontibacter oryzae TaxID=2304593 RepID=A0A399RWE6_9BACT|nr:hypothetical protein D1627_17415 [Pontibacter oryzae]
MACQNFSFFFKGFFKLYYFRDFNTSLSCSLKQKSIRFIPIFIPLKLGSVNTKLSFTLLPYCKAFSYFAYIDFIPIFASFWT